MMQLMRSFLALPGGGDLRQLGDPPGSSACNPLSVPGKRPQPNGSLPI